MLSRVNDRKIYFEQWLIVKFKNVSYFHFDFAEFSKLTELVVTNALTMR